MTADAIAIGAVIVGYRSADEISDCVRGCLKDPLVSRVVIVDNSRDAATEAAVLSIGRSDIVEYVPASSNAGYAHAVNFGARHLLDGATLTHIAIVNPDLSLSAPLSKVIQCVGDRRYSILSADINDAPDPTHARFATTAGTELRKALFGARAVPCVERPPVGEIVEVPEVSGALMVMPVRTFEALGGFDERFELYYEDVDLCQRAALLDPLILVGLPVGLHSGGASYRGATGPAYRAFRVSRLRFLRKRYGFVTGAVMGVVFGVLEFVSRSATSQSEGSRTRWRSLRDQFGEAMRPSSATVLSQREPIP